MRYQTISVLTVAKIIEAAAAAGLDPAGLWPIVGGGGPLALERRVLAGGRLGDEDEADIRVARGDRRERVDGRAVEGELGVGPAVRVPLGDDGKENVVHGRASAERGAGDVVEVGRVR